MSIEKFLTNKQLKKNVAQRTLQSYRSFLYKALSEMGKPLEELSEGEILTYMATLKAKNSSWNLYLVVLKDFYRFHNIHLLDGVIPRKDTAKDYQVRDADIQYMLDACRNPRDRVIILTLAKYGFRASELCSIQMKHVEFDDERTGGVYLTCEKSKTEARKVLALGVNAEFRNWLAQHPDPNNPEAYFICSFQTSPGNPMTRNMVKQYIQKVEIRARKLHPDLRHIHPHVLRHFATTEESKQGLNETAIKLRRGWSANSKMLSRYLHVTNQDANNQYAEKNGVNIKEVQKPLTERKCPKCLQSNIPTAIYCARCGSPLDLKTAEHIETKEKAGLEKLLNLIREHPDLAEQLQALKL